LNTRSRLATRDGPGAELRVAKSLLGGVEVSIRLPYATAEGGGRSRVDRARERRPGHGAPRAFR
jgi:hypothetical protein